MIHEMIVIRKSPERKFKRGSGRFITGQSPSNPSLGYTFLLFPDYHTGEYPPIFTFNVIDVNAESFEDAAINPKYDTNLEGVPFGVMSFLSKVDQSNIRIKGRYTERRSVDIPLATVKFYREYFQSDVDNITVDAKTAGFPYFPSSLSSLGLGGFIKVTGDFEVSLRRVALGQGKYEWQRAYKFKEGSIDMENSDLSGLVSLVKNAVNDAERERMIAILIEELRRNGTYLDIFNARSILRQRGFDDAMLADGVIEAALNGVTMKKDYDPQYFHALKSIQEKGTPVFYGDQGFIFRTEGKWVWETPKPNTATYIFNGAVTIADIRSFLSRTSRMEILKNASLQKEMGYKGRAIHPPDEENGEGMSRWMRDIQFAR